MTSRTGLLPDRGLFPENIAYGDVMPMKTDGMVSEVVTRDISD